MRLFLVCLSALAWASLAWLISHRSDSPTVLGRYSLTYFATLLSLALVAFALSLSLFGKLHQRLQRARSELLLLIVSSAAALLLAEVFVRVVDPLGVWYYEESKRYRQAQLPDPDLVYRHPTRWEAILQGVRIATNEFGFRDREVHSKRTDELRVLVLGDSVALGWGVAEHETFPRRLEGILGGQLADRSVRVINTGVGSYNTEQEYAVLRRYFTQLAPDVVVLVVTSNDDAEPTPLLASQAAVGFWERSPPKIAASLLNQLWFYRTIYHLSQYRVYTETPTPDSPGWRRALAAYTAYGGFCEGHGITCATLYHRMYVSPKNDAFVAAFSGIARTRGWTFVDTRSWFPEESDARALTNSVVDSHPNGEGHRIIATNMARVLLEILDR